MTDVSEMVSRQKRLAARLSSSTGPAMLDVARELAATLNEVCDDDQLWSKLRNGSQSGVGPLQQLVLLDWEALLREVKLESDEMLAGELMDALETDSWTEVRNLLGRLARQLDSDVTAPKPAGHQRWWGALRDKVAYGVSALGRVSKSALLIESVVDAGSAGGAQLAIVLITGTPFGPAGQILAAALAGLAKATITELRRCFAEERAGRLGHRLDTLFAEGALMRGNVGRQLSQLEMLETLVAVAPSTAFDGELPDDIVRLLADMRRWSARVGAELASAWSFVAAHVSHSAIRDVQAATTYLADLRASLVNIAKALLAGGASAATKAIASARVAMEGVQQALDGLAQSLQDNGFDPTHPW